MKDKGWWGWEWGRVWGAVSVPRRALSCLEKGGSPDPAGVCEEGQGCGGGGVRSSSLVKGDERDVTSHSRDFIVVVVGHHPPISLSERLGSCFSKAYIQGRLRGSIS